MAQPPSGVNKSRAGTTTGKPGRRVMGERPRLRSREGRSDSFAQGLRAQRAYVRARRGKGTGLVVGPAFLRGIRRSGYLSTATALCELIDNSIEAGSRSIHVVFGFSGSEAKPDAIAVLDDGHGMDVGMLRLALAWGGTHREGSRGGFGRFGYGLPTASMSQGRTVSVFSRAPGKPLARARLSIGASDDTKRANEPVITVARAGLPDWLEEYATKFVPALLERRGHGAVVVLEDLDNVTWKTAVALERNLERSIGVTYRSFVRRIGLYVQGRRVQPIDPLFLTRSARFFDLDSERALPVECPPIHLKTEAGATVAIGVRAAYFPPTFGRIDKTREAGGRNANARFVVMKEHLGIIVCRLERQIETVSTGLWTQFKNNDRYWAIELDFPPALDEALSITTNKQRIIFSDSLRESLRKSELPKLVEQLRSRYQRDRKRMPAVASSRVAALSPNGHLPAEEAAGDAFYRVNDSHPWLVLNNQHPFFKKLYGRLDQPAARSAVNAVLTVLAEAELRSKSADKDFYERERLAWSRLLEKLLLEGHVAAAAEAPR